MVVTYFNPCVIVLKYQGTAISIGITVTNIIFSMMWPFLDLFVHCVACPLPLSYCVAHDDYNYIDITKYLIPLDFISYCIFCEFFHAVLVVITGSDKLSG